MSSVTTTTGVNVNATTNCQLFYGLQLPPYFLMLGASAVFTLGGMLFYAAFRSCGLIPPPDPDMSDEPIVRGRSVTTTMTTYTGRAVAWTVEPKRIGTRDLFTVNSYWLGVQSLLQCAYFVYLVVTLAMSPTYALVDNPAHDLPWIWAKYQEIYGRFINGGFPVLFAAIVFHLYDCYKAGSCSWRIARALEVLCVLIALPPLFTHCLPMFFCYLWIPLALGLVVLSVVTCFEQSEPTRANVSTFGCVVRIFMGFWFGVALSTMFNYATMVYFYDGRLLNSTEYWNVISTEFYARNSPCYFNVFLGSIRQICLFASLL